jgi:hypothetical protein
MNYYVWSIALYGAETVALRNLDQKYFEFLICEWKKDGEQLE